MAHLSHVCELSTDKVKAAVTRLQKEAFATIRSQSPVMRGINDDAQVWAEVSYTIFSLLSPSDLL